MSARYEQWDTNPAYEHQDPMDTYRCAICKRETMEDFVSEDQFDMGICEGDTCAEIRISQLVTAELDKLKYEPLLERLSNMLIPVADGGDDLRNPIRELQTRLLEIKLAALHELNNAADRRKQ